VRQVASGPGTGTRHRFAHDSAAAAATLQWLLLLLLLLLLRLRRLLRLLRRLWVAQLTPQATATWSLRDRTRGLEGGSTRSRAPRLPRHPIAALYE
jgi:hypothetical protein